MAVGDIVYTKFYTAGNLKGVCGTLEASSTSTTFAILGTKGTIVNATVTNQDNVDTYLQCAMNSDDGTPDSLAGSLEIDTSSSNVDTLAFNVLYV